MKRVKERGLSKARVHILGREGGNKRGYSSLTSEHAVWTLSSIESPQLDQVIHALLAFSDPGNISCCEVWGKESMAHMVVLSRSTFSPDRRKNLKQHSFKPTQPASRLKSTSLNYTVRRRKENVRSFFPVMYEESRVGMVFFLYF